MRETLHPSTINMFEDPAALAKVNGNGPTGLYDWYIGCTVPPSIRTALNTDFLGRGTR